MGCINERAEAPILSKKIHPVQQPGPFLQNVIEDNHDQPRLAQPHEEINKPENKIASSISKNTLEGNNEKPKEQLNSRPVRQVKVYVINNENLEEMISEARRIEDNNEAILLYNQIATFLTQLKDKRLTTMKKLGYVEQRLAELCSLTHSQDCQKHERRALKIYYQFPSEFYQEIIAILNNSAMRNLEQEKLDSAEQKCDMIMPLISNFYSVFNEGRLMLLNNIAVVYCKVDRKKQGLKIFQNVLQGIIHFRINSDQLTSIVQQNYELYKQ